MPSPPRFPPDVVEAVDRAKILGIRAGTGDHRVIGVWPVVAEGRVFVRSWGVKPDGWYDAFLREPRGTMTVGERAFDVRAVRTRSERLRAAVDAGYRAKFPTPASKRYVDDLCGDASRATTTELVPR